MITPIAYPKILNAKDIPELKECLIYPVERYDMDGVSLTMSAKDGSVEMQTADWDGHVLRHGDGKFSEALNEVMKDFLKPITEIFMYARMTAAQFYFSCGSSGPSLVDVRTALNGFIGPGFLDDLFSNAVRTQVIRKPCACTPSMFKAWVEEGATLLKSSVFKCVTRDGSVYPMYGATWDNVG